MNTVIYSKINRERRKEFQLLTNIVRLDSGDKVVVKRPLLPDGTAHIIHMHEYLSAIKNDKVRPVSSKIDNGSIVMDYVEGKSLCEILLGYLRDSDFTRALEFLKKYRDLVYRLGNDSGEFVCTPEFEAVFGSVSLDGVMAGKQLNIDCILENIIKSQDEYLIIDYEWYFDFYIPYDFLLYRSILDLYCNYHADIKDLGSFVDLCSEMGISESAIDVYSRMNNRFIDYVYDNSNGYNSIKARYAKDKLDVQGIIKSDRNTACLYLDVGEGFSEDDVRLNEVVESKPDELIENIIEYDLSGVSGLKQLRFDPMTGACFVKINSIIADDTIDLMGNITDMGSNTINNGNGEYIFFTDDPHLLFAFDSDISKLTVSYCIFPLESSFISFFQDYIKIRDGREQNLIDSIEAYNINACLYYDVGMGFNEELKIVSPIGISDYYDYKKIVLKYDLSEINGIKQLRFDPMEMSGLVRIDSVRANDSIDLKWDEKEAGTYSVSFENDEYLFFNNDPQFIIPMDIDVKSLVIEFCIAPVSITSCEKMLNVFVEAGGNEGE